MAGAGPILAGAPVNRRRVERARRKEQDLLGRIREAAGAGDRRRYRHLVFNYLRDDTAKLAALDARNRRAPPRYRVPLKDLKNLVPEVYHYSGDGRAHHCCAQRKKVYSRLYYRKHGGT